MSDERLDFLGEIYLRNPRLVSLGISFESFLSAPGAVLWSEIAGILACDDVLDFIRLLPAQRAVRDSLDAAHAGQREIVFGGWEGKHNGASLLVRDGTLFEKLRHHAFPKHYTLRQKQKVEEGTTS